MTSGMAEQWLDSLSEDWESQPRSDPGSIQNSTPPSSHDGINQQLSLKEALCQRQGSVVIRSLPIGQIGALQQQSLNRRNARQQGTESGDGKSLRPAMPLRGRFESQGGTIGSTGTTKHSTVARRAQSSSPRKSDRPEVIPEWRQALMGKGSRDMPKDLFSAIPLEGLFNHNSIRSTTSSLQPSAPISIVSAPPPQPTASGLATRPQGPRPPTSKFGSVMKPLSAVSEVTENSSVAGGNDSGCVEKSDPRRNSVTQKLGTGADLGRSYQIPRVRDVSSTLSKRSVSAGAAAVADEDFTPIFLSRSSGEHGTIRYEAVTPKGEPIRISQPSQTNPNLGSERFDDDEPTKQLASEAQLYDDNVSTTSFPSDLSQGTQVEDLDTEETQEQPSDLEHCLPSVLQSQLDDSNQENFGVKLQQSRPQTPEGNILPVEPRTPKSSSPLKLFGNHDTYTKQRLDERLDQLDGGGPSIRLPTQYSPSRMLRRKTLAKGADVEDGTEMREHTAPKLGPDSVNFGQGELTDFTFQEQAFDGKPSAMGQVGQPPSSAKKTRFEEDEYVARTRPSYVTPHRSASTALIMTSQLWPDVDEDEIQMSKKRKRVPSEGSSLITAAVVPSSAPQLSTYVNRGFIMPQTPSKAYSTCDLTTLPDFTLHQRDEAALEVTGAQPKVRSHRSLSQSHEGLVRALTDVEPFEPHWDIMRDVELVGRGLETLHELCDYCGRLESLNAKQNNLGQLHGVPSSLRTLNASQNRLTSMTAWGPLTNLQSLDVSGNDIDNLESLKGLIHLRDLKLDDNQITNLDGLSELSGLLTLSAAGNQIQDLQFRNSGMRRLRVVNVRRNQIRGVRDLNTLSSLEELDLSSNLLRELAPEHGLRQSSLKTLDVQNNALVRLDISGLPAIQHLQADRNHLCDVDGALGAGELISVSLREQDLSEPDTTLSISDFYDIRSLSISAIKLPSVGHVFSQGFLAMRNLELASCALTSLPPDFAKIFPSLQNLNINFNAVKNLSPLQGLERLRSLQLTGNRVTRLRDVISVIQWMPQLAVLDLRDNPVNHGFYCQHPESSAVVPLNDSKLSSGNKSDAYGNSSKAAAPYCLPVQDSTLDRTWRDRLDLGTWTSRLIYHILISLASQHPRGDDQATKLCSLDGLSEISPNHPPFVDSPRSTAEKDVWNRLRELRLIAPVQDHCVASEVPQPDNVTYRLYDGEADGANFTWEDSMLSIEEDVLLRRGLSSGPLGRSGGRRAVSGDISEDVRSGREVRTPTPDAYPPSIETRSPKRVVGRMSNPAQQPHIDETSRVSRLAAAPHIRPALLPSPAPSRPNSARAPERVTEAQNMQLPQSGDGSFEEPDEDDFSTIIDALEELRATESTESRARNLVERGNEEWDRNGRGGSDNPVLYHHNHTHDHEGREFSCMLADIYENSLDSFLC